MKQSSNKSAPSVLINSRPNKSPASGSQYILKGFGVGCGPGLVVTQRLRPSAVSAGPFTRPQALSDDLLLRDTLKTKRRQKLMTRFDSGGRHMLFTLHLSPQGSDPV